MGLCDGVGTATATEFFGLYPRGEDASGLAGHRRPDRLAAATTVQRYPEASARISPARRRHVDRTAPSAALAVTPRHLVADRPDAAHRYSRHHLAADHRRRGRDRDREGRDDPHLDDAAARPLARSPSTPLKQSRPPANRGEDLTSVTDMAPRLRGTGGATAWRVAVSDRRIGGCGGPLVGRILATTFDKSGGSRTKPVACFKVVRLWPRPPGEAFFTRCDSRRSPPRWIPLTAIRPETKMEFITQADKDKIESDLKELHIRGKEIILRIAEARALGDLKENAEYHAAREDQAFNNERIKQLQERLETAQVTDHMDIPDDVVFVGATVRLKEVGNGDEDLYKIVGTASNDLSLDYIEVTTTSPLGSGLMKARVGDIVRVDLPKGPTQFEILEII